MASNLNNTTPAAVGTGKNVLFQTDGAGNDSAYMPLFVASGASHAVGLVPDPGSSAGSTRFLREDATWAVPAGGGGGGTAFQSLQRQTTLIADAVNTTLNVLGDTSTVFGSATASAQVATSTRGAAVGLINASTANCYGFHTNDNSGSGGSYVTGRNLKYLAEFYYTAVADNQNWIYFGEPPGNYLTGVGNTPAAASGLTYAGFRFSTGAGDTNWQALSGNGATDVITDTGIAPGTGSHQFAVIFNDTTPNITFYIDGSLVATHTTSLPASGKFFIFMGSNKYASTSYSLGVSQVLIASDL